MIEEAPTVLIVDDERDLLEAVEFNVQREGYRTAVAATANAALERAVRAPHPDLVILDLMLPDLSGIEVCRRLRQIEATATTPVLMLTARAEEIDRVVGFEVGADDYLTKPFSMRELLLRVRAILRRGRPVEGETGELRCGSLRLSIDDHRVWVAEDELKLTALEFRLLATLLSRRGRVQTREQLLEEVWHMRPDVDTRTVDTHVLRLRKKLGETGGYIETLRGVGYRFAPGA